MALTAALIFRVIAPAPAQVPVAVHVDRSAPAGRSHVEIGVTHTQHDLDSARTDPSAVARVVKLLPEVCRYQIEPIMGWGADNPEPSPGVFNWESLDRRMKLIESMHAVPVITLCAAPDWMKGGEAGKTNWSRIEAAPLPEHFADFAALAKTVAQRYRTVRRFQVWNEFKGLWDAPGRNWNYARYTDLYNQVYDALKSVDSSIQVGGPYLVIEGTGLNPHEWYGARPITERNMKVIDYWLQHKHGADFIVLDRSITDGNHDPTHHSEAEVMGQTGLFGDIVRQTRARTDLPIWWAEFYGGEGQRDPAFVAAEHASIYLHMAIAETPQVACLWGFLPGEGGGYQLFTAVDRPDGGQPTANYSVLKLFHDNFPPGTNLYHTTCTSPDVEALATREHTLLINKRPANTAVNLDGLELMMGRYEVRLLDAAPRR